MQYIFILWRTKALNIIDFIAIIIIVSTAGEGDLPTEHAGYQQAYLNSEIFFPTSQNCVHEL